MIGARMVIACVVAAAFVSPARAQGFPNKTMRLIVPLTPGGSNVSAAQVKQMNGGHKRNTGPMLSSLRCGAKIRPGRPCKSPSVLGKKRCRMHGGALGSGAPRGNKNALKHGRFTPEAIAESGAYSRTGAAGAQAAPADRVTCVAAHQAGIQRPDGFSSFASAPSARTAAVMNASLAVRTSALSSLTLSEPHARLGVIEKFNS